MSAGQNYRDGLKTTGSNLHYSMFFLAYALLKSYEHDKGNVWITTILKTPLNHGYHWLATLNIS